MSQKREIIDLIGDDATPSPSPSPKRVKKEEFKYDEEDQKLHDLHAEWVKKNVDFGVFERLLDFGVYQGDRDLLKRLLDRRMTTKGGLFGKSTERYDWVHSICVDYDDDEEAAASYDYQIEDFEQGNKDDSNPVHERLIYGICQYICTALYDHDVGCEDWFGESDEQRESFTAAVVEAIPFHKMHKDLDEKMDDRVAVEEVFHAAIEYVINYEYGGDKAKFNGEISDEDSDSDNEN